MLNIKIELRAKCKKHPRYDPAKDGAAGIKGGCHFCLTLLGALDHFQEVENAAAEIFGRPADGAHRYVADWANPLLGSADFRYGGFR